MGQRVQNRAGGAKGGEIQFSINSPKEAVASKLRKGGKSAGGFPWRGRKAANIS